MFEKLTQGKFWLSLLSQLSLLLIFIYAINWYQSRNVVQSQAPKLQAVSTHGEEINLAELNQEGVTLIYFWGDWCPVCTLVSPTIDDLAKEYQVLTIAMSSGDKAQVRQYLEQEGYSFTTVADTDASISQRWGVSATPTIVIINSDGSIASVITGVTSRWSILFRLMLAS